MTDGMTPLTIDEVDDYLVTMRETHARHPGTSCEGCAAIARVLLGFAQQLLAQAESLAPSHREYARFTQAAGEAAEAASSYSDGAMSPGDYASEDDDDEIVIIRG